MHTLHIDEKELKQYIEQKLRHAYIDKYIQNPFIDENKMNLLNQLYDGRQMPIMEKHKYITTIMLVQIALDTHELVPNDNEYATSETEKQLSVLAGDYYSGLYYYFLSELKDVKMVQMLGKAIRLINEEKMKLFYGDLKTFPQLLSAIEQIESVLFTQTADHLQMDGKIIPVIQKYLLIHRLKLEYSHLASKKKTCFQTWTKTLFTETELAAELKIAIAKQELEIDTLLADLPYRYYHVRKMISHSLALTYNISMVEEG